MLQILMRYGARPLFIASAGVLFFVGSVVFVGSANVEHLASVEVGYAAFSPKGEVGGSIFPASCESIPEFEHNLGECDVSTTLSFEVQLDTAPNILFTGEVANVHWKVTTGVGWLPPTINDEIALFRVGTSDASQLDYFKNTVPDTERTVPVTIVQPAGNYEFRYFYNDAGVLKRVATSNQFTVGNSRIDLVSTNLAMSGGGTVITIGAPAVTFTADVKNIGTAAATTFDDQFLYAYVTGGVVGTFYPITPDISHLSLGPNATEVDTSGSFSPLTPGTIVVRHYVDAHSAVAEANEVDNFSEKTFTVRDTLAVTCSVAGSPIIKGDSAVWTATLSVTGAPNYTYEWSGTDGFSDTNVVPGTSNTQSHTYNVPGTKTASVRVTDSAGETTGWVACSNSLTVNNPPTPVANIEARVTGGPWTGGTLYIVDGQEIELRWNSVNASECAGTNFSTGAAPNGFGQTVGAGGVVEPGPGLSTPYSVTCHNGAPPPQDTDTVTVNKALVGVGGAASIRAIPSRVRTNQSTVIDGTVNAHTGCVITGRAIDPSNLDGDGDADTLDLTTLGIVAGYGPYTTGPIVGTTAYTLSCTSGGTGTAIVRALPTFEEI